MSNRRTVITFSPGIERAISIIGSVFEGLRVVNSRLKGFSAKPFNNLVQLDLQTETGKVCRFFCEPAVAHAVSDKLLAAALKAAPSDLEEPTNAPA